MIKERCPFCGRYPKISTAGNKETGLRYGAYCGSNNMEDDGLPECPVSLEDPGWHTTKLKAEEHWDMVIGDMITDVLVNGPKQAT